MKQLRQLHAYRRIRMVLGAVLPALQIHDDDQNRLVVEPRKRKRLLFEQGVHTKPTKLPRAEDGVLLADREAVVIVAADLLDVEALIRSQLLPGHLVARPQFLEVLLADAADAEFLELLGFTINHGGGSDSRIVAAGAIQRLVRGIPGRHIRQVEKGALLLAHTAAADAGGGGDASRTGFKTQRGHCIGGCLLRFFRRGLWNNLVEVDIVDGILLVLDDLRLVYPMGLPRVFAQEQHGDGREHGDKIDGSPRAAAVDRTRVRSVVRAGAKRHDGVLRENIFVGAQEAAEGLDGCTLGVRNASDGAVAANGFARERREDLDEGHAVRDGAGESEQSLSTVV
mmetsp:Transcript_10609/g.26598  ORF Transcript_10609/g.26598 Transcript_10609/m.26598 type:complete len:340 (+) Transcript_10609:1569-2588(+)